MKRVTQIVTLVLLLLSFGFNMFLLDKSMKLREYNEHLTRVIQEQSGELEPGLVPSCSVDGKHWYAMSSDGLCRPPHRNGERNQQ